MFDLLHKHILLQPAAKHLYEAIKTWIIAGGAEAIALRSNEGTLSRNLHWLGVELAVNDMHVVPLVLLVLTLLLCFGVVCYVVLCRWYGVFLKMLFVLRWTISTKIGLVRSRELPQLLRWEKANRRHRYTNRPLWTMLFYLKIDKFHSFDYFIIIYLFIY